MSATLYFAKINVTSHIPEMYESPEKRNKVLRTVLKNIRMITCQRVDIREIGDEEYTYEADYRFTFIDKINNSVLGAVAKESPVFINKLNEETGEVYSTPEDNFEMIYFYLDFNKEIVAFYKKRRFGYNEFTIAFESLLNKCMQIEEEEYIIDVNLLREGLDINNIKEELKKLGYLKELKISIMPPNPDEELLDDLDNNADFYIERFNEGNVSYRSVLFESKVSDGINLDSRIIDDEINTIDKIHSKVSDEEATGKGYAVVEANNKSGKKFTTESNRPIRDTISDSQKNKLDKFVEVCKDKIASLSFR